MPGGHCRSGRALRRPADWTHARARPHHPPPPRILDGSDLLSRRAPGHQPGTAPPGRPRAGGSPLPARRTRCSDGFQTPRALSTASSTPTGVRGRRAPGPQISFAPEHIRAPARRLVSRAFRRIGGTPAAPPRRRLRCPDIAGGSLRAAASRHRRPLLKASPARSVRRRPGKFASRCTPSPAAQHTPADRLKHRRAPSRTGQS